MIIFHFLQTNIFGIVTSNLIVIHMLFSIEEKVIKLKLVFQELCISLRVLTDNVCYRINKEDWELSISSYIAFVCVRFHGVLELARAP